MGIEANTALKTKGGCSNNRENSSKMAYTNFDQGFGSTNQEDMVGLG